MWDDWHDIAAAQARADQEDAARRDARQRRREASQLPESTEEPIAARGPNLTPTDESRPLLRLMEPDPPVAEPTVDAVEGVRLWAMRTRELLQKVQTRNR